MIINADDIVLVMKAILAMGAATVLYHIAIGVIHLIQDWRRGDKD